MDQKIKKSLLDYLDEAFEASVKVSDIVRNLNLGGIAIIWLFRNPLGYITLFPDTLILPLILIISSLILDVFQYLWRSISLFIFFHKWENLYNAKKITEKEAEDILAPKFISTIGWIIFGIKVLSSLLGFTLLILFLANKI